MEIERKFWIQKSNHLFKYERMSLIEQCYINKPDDFYEIRLRKYHGEDRYYLEFKSKGDLIREEFGTKITEEQYDNILNGMSLENRFNSIIKKRYYLGDGVFFDEYDGELAGYNSLEVEGDEDYVRNYILPYPFNDGIEVTYDSRFKNRNVAGKTYDDIKNYKENVGN